MDDFIIEEDKIVLNTEKLLVPLNPIRRWAMKWGCRFLRQAFKVFLVPNALFTETKEIHTQAVNAKAVKRMIVQYFYFEH